MEANPSKLRLKLPLKHYLDQRTLPVGGGRIPVSTEVLLDLIRPNKKMCYLNVLKPVCAETYLN